MELSWLCPKGRHLVCLLRVLNSESRILYLLLISGAGLLIELTALPHPRRWWCSSWLSSYSGLEVPSYFCSLWMGCGYQKQQKVPQCELNSFQSLNQISTTHSKKRIVMIIKVLGRTAEYQQKESPGPGKGLLSLELKISACLPAALNPGWNIAE